MEQLRALVVGGVGDQRKQLQTLEEQLQAFLKLKDEVLFWGHLLLEHGVLVRPGNAHHIFILCTLCRLLGS